VPTVHGPLTAMAAKSLSKRMTSSSMQGGHPGVGPVHLGVGAHHHHHHVNHQYHGAAGLHHSGGGSGLYFSNGGDLHSAPHLEQVPETEAGNEAEAAVAHRKSISSEDRRHSTDSGLVRLPSVRLGPPEDLPSQDQEKGGGAGGTPADSVAKGAPHSRNAQDMMGISKQHYMSNTELGHLPPIRSLPPGTIQQLAAQAARVNAEAKQQAAFRPSAAPAELPAAPEEEDTQPLIARSTAY
jgi:hypothetical protein